jgi:hypothetical protein
MKKITLLTISILFAFLVQAQLFNIGGLGIGYLYVGPKAGGNASFNTIDVGNGVDKTASYGYQIGAVGKLGITKKLAVQPEFVYTSKGFGTSSSIGTSNTNYKYFGLPIIAKYAFAAISGVQIYGSGGFYTDVLTGVESVHKYADGSEYTEEYDDLSPFTRVDFGFNVGGGANIPLKNRDVLNFDFRFGFGVTNVEKNISTSTKNISIQLSAIYLVDLTKWVHFKGKSILEEDAYDENGGAPAGGSKVKRE